MAAKKSIPASTVIRLGIAELEARTGKHRATLRRWYESGQFPAPEYIGEFRTWKLSAIERWEAEQAARPPEARRGIRNLVAASAPGTAA